MPKELESVRLDFEARASGRLSGDGGDATVINFRDSTAGNADQVMVMGGLTRDVSMSAVGKVNPLNKILVGEEFKEAEDGGAPNSKVAPVSICDQVCSGEVPLSPCNQSGELTTGPGKADPRLIKRFEQRTGHGGILPELRLSLNRRWGALHRAHRASTGMIRA